MGVSKNSGTPKSSILRVFSMINHPFWGTPIFGNSHIDSYQIPMPHRHDFKVQKAASIMAMDELPVKGQGEVMGFA